MKGEHMRFGERRYGGGEDRGMGGGGFRSRGPRRDFGGEKPVKEGQTYDVEILEVGSKGDGITKIQNFVIFVPGTKKGDKVKIRVTQVKPRNAVAEVVGAEGASETIKEIATEAEAEGAELEKEAATEVGAEAETEEEADNGAEGEE
jgi:predicted RNA-binding protein with TRAM domain